MGDVIVNYSEAIQLNFVNADKAGKRDARIHSFRNDLKSNDGYVEMMLTSVRILSCVEANKLLIDFQSQSFPLVLDDSNARIL